jgi:hypothetical protein
MADPDPEQILRMLDAELVLARTKRHGGGVNRNAVRIFSILFILVATVAALAVLQYMASELHGRAADMGKLPVEKQNSQTQPR